MTTAAKYCDLARDTALYYMDEADYTPQGLVFLQAWGSLPSAMNTALTMLQVQFGHQLVANRLPFTLL